jgi:hypothetical protein
MKWLALGHCREICQRSLSNLKRGRETLPRFKLLRLLWFDVSALFSGVLTGSELGNLSGAICAQIAVICWLEINLLFFSASFGIPITKKHL